MYILHTNPHFSTPSLSLSPEINFSHDLPRHHDAVKRYAYSRFPDPFSSDSEGRVVDKITVLGSLKRTLEVMLTISASHVR